MPVHKPHHSILIHVLFYVCLKTQRSLKYIAFMKVLSSSSQELAIERSCPSHIKFEDEPLKSQLREPCWQLPKLWLVPEKRV